MKCPQSKEAADTVVVVRNWWCIPELGMGIGQLTLPRIGTQLFMVAILLPHLCPTEAISQQPAPEFPSMPHGISHEKPLEMSPSAVKFFAPDRSPQYSNHRSSSVLRSPEPADPSQRLQCPSSPGAEIGRGGKAGIVISVAFGIILAVGGSYIYVTRRSNIRRANSILLNP